MLLALGQYEHQCPVSGPVTGFYSLAALGTQTGPWRGSKSVNDLSSTESSTRSSARSTDSALYCLDSPDRHFRRYNRRNRPEYDPREEVEKSARVSRYRKQLDRQVEHNAQRRLGAETERRREEASLECRVQRDRQRLREEFAEQHRLAPHKATGPPLAHPRHSSSVSTLGPHCAPLTRFTHSGPDCPAHMSPDSHGHCPRPTRPRGHTDRPLPPRSPSGREGQSVLEAEHQQTPPPSAARQWPFEE